MQPCCRQPTDPAAVVAAFDTVRALHEPRPRVIIFDTSM